MLLSCNAFKAISKDSPSEPTTETTNPPVEKEKKPIKVKEEVVVVEEKVTKETVYLQGLEFQVEPHKNEFKVALILPFNFNAQTSRERRMSDYMLEYYQGVKLALTELEYRGFKLKLYVYDNENSTSVLRGILKKSDLSKMDVIIGPMGQSQMEIVSSFGLDKGIPVISPISSVDSLPAPNPKFYNTTPGYDSKAQKVSKYLKERFKNNSVVIITDVQTHSLSVRNAYVQRLKESGLKNIRTEPTTFSDWANVLPKNDTTTVVILSHNPTVVSTTLSKIYQTKKNVVVIGDNSWSNFQDNDYKFWNKLNVHLVASDFVDEASEEVKNFKINFRLINRTDPGVYAYLGYDQFLFMGEFLMAFGEYFPSYINNKEFNYLSSTYRYNYTKGFNQNTNVFLLKFDNYTLRPME